MPLSQLFSGLKLSQFNSPRINVTGFSLPTHAAIFLVLFFADRTKLMGMFLVEVPGSPTAEKKT
jgi:hypothetical protein